WSDPACFLYPVTQSSTRSGPSWQFVPGLPAGLISFRVTPTHACHLLFVRKSERSLGPENGIGLAAPRSSHVLGSIRNIAEAARSTPRCDPRAPLQPSH